MKTREDSNSRYQTEPNVVSPIHVLLDSLYRIVMAPEIWRRGHEQRMQLARVETRILRDAGISEAQRFIKINKPFR